MVLLSEVSDCESIDCQDKTSDSSSQRGVVEAGERMEVLVPHSGAETNLVGKTHRLTIEEEATNSAVALAVSDEFHSKSLTEANTEDVKDAFSDSVAALEEVLKFVTPSQAISSFDKGTISGEAAQRSMGSTLSNARNAGAQRSENFDNDERLLEVNMENINDVFSDSVAALEAALKFITETPAISGDLKGAIPSEAVQLRGKANMEDVKDVFSDSVAALEAVLKFVTRSPAISNWDRGTSSGEAVQRGMASTPSTARNAKAKRSANFDIDERLLEVNMENVNDVFSDSVAALEAALKFITETPATSGDLKGAIPSEAVQLRGKANTEDVNNVFSDSVATLEAALKFVTHSPAISRCDKDVVSDEAAQRGMRSSPSNARNASAKNSENFDNDERLLEVDIENVNDVFSDSVAALETALKFITETPAISGDLKGAIPSEAVQFRGKANMEDVNDVFSDSVATLEAALKFVTHSPAISASDKDTMSGEAVQRGMGSSPSNAWNASAERSENFDADERLLDVHMENVNDVFSDSVATLEAALKFITETPAIPGDLKGAMPSEAVQLRGDGVRSSTANATVKNSENCDGKESSWRHVRANNYFRLPILAGVSRFEDSINPSLPLGA